jgi:flagellar hook protein FlgE
MSNFTIGLAGLQNTSLAIDNTSNNIANANTVGYKAGEYIFADQYFKAIDPSDANRVGQGSQRLAVRRALTYGTMQNSQNPLDMAIGGDGWFRVLSNPEDPSSMHYTRNGQFAIDKNGWIVNQNGMYLTGFQPTSDKTGVSDDTRGLGTTNGKLRMPPDYANGVQTRVSKISAILDSRENAFVVAGGVAFDPTQNTFNSRTTQTIFDSNGTGHTLDVYYRRVTDSNLRITSNATGYVYTPGAAASPNTLSDTQVVIPGASALTVQTAPITNVLGKITGQTTAGSILFDSKVAAAAIPAGAKIFMNGIDTGLTVASGAGGPKALGDTFTSISVTGTAINIPASASFTFYPADVTDAINLAGGASVGATSIIIDGVNAPTVGQRLFSGSTDTGLTVTAYNSTSKVVTLNGTLSAAIADNAAVTFKNTLDMTLTAPDGTSIVVQGTTNKPASDSILTAVRSNVEVYASINGVFYSNDTSAAAFSNKGAAAETPGTGTYKTVATMGFIGGRNIDSLITDTGSGKPVFSTTTKLTTRVSAGSQQATTIPLIFELDLSDTQMQASSFMVNQSYQNGEPRSELSSVTIDGSGMIVGVYGNGRKIVAGQIALAQFDADEQLIPAGNNVFAPSHRSGTEGDNGVRIGRAGDGSFGEIKSMAVEASTVDLSNELVKLMILQRMYSANSQSLKAFDQTLRDTIQMTS